MQWNGIKNQIKKINNDPVVEYDKDYMKIQVQNLIQMIIYH